MRCASPEGKGRNVSEVPPKGKIFSFPASAGLASAAPGDEQPDASERTSLTRFPSRSTRMWPEVTESDNARASFLVTFPAYPFELENL